MKKPFITSYVDGNENVMVVSGDVKEIRFNIRSRDLSIVYQDADKYTREDIDEFSWQSLKALVLSNGGEWTNKADAIEFLIGKAKGE